jgi:hypothetical protein
MLISKRTETYQRRVEQFISERRDNIMSIPDDVLRAINDIQVTENANEVEDVLCPHFMAVPEQFYSMCGFAIGEFEHLFQLTADKLMFKGRGKKTSISAKDILFLLLHYLRRYPRIEEMAAAFEIKPSTLEKLLHKAIAAVLDLWITKFVTIPAEHTAMPVNIDFHEATFIVDATVQQINKPIGSFHDIKQWYSGKHGIYCLKSQVMCDMKGAAIHIVTGIKGARHDLDVFRESIPELGHIMDQHPDLPRMIIGDKGYQANDIECLITPHKGQPLDLTRVQNQFNDRLGKARVIIENYFGRLKSRYSIIGSKYRGAHEHYNHIFMVCCALVNFEIRQIDHPLRCEDGDFYRRAMALNYQQERDQVKQNNAVRRAQYQARLNKIFIGIQPE